MDCNHTWTASAPHPPCRKPAGRWLNTSQPEPLKSWHKKLEPQQSRMLIYISIFPNISLHDNLGISTSLSKKCHECNLKAQGQGLTILVPNTSRPMTSELKAPRPKPIGSNPATTPDLFRQPSKRVSWQGAHKIRLPQQPRLALSEPRIILYEILTPKLTQIRQRGGAVEVQLFEAVVPTQDARGGLFREIRSSSSYREHQ